MKSKPTFLKAPSLRNHAVSALLSKGGIHAKDSKKGKRKAQRKLSKALCTDF